MGYLLFSYFALQTFDFTDNQLNERLFKTESPDHMMLPVILMAIEKSLSHNSVPFQ